MSDHLDETCPTMFDEATTDDRKLLLGMRKEAQNAT
jgi:hypothetical protein